MAPEPEPLTGEQQRQWFLDTGHCGACGNPGHYCTCRTPCPCADLHPVGAGFADDALDTFTAPQPVSDDQSGLW